MVHSAENWMHVGLGCINVTSNPVQRSFSLLTRETPAEIAAERKSLRRILEASASQANAVEKRMEGYTSLLESRLTHLPKELETGLDPPRIANLLGESLRQCFKESGLPDTARALDQSCSEMSSVQEQLVNVLREVAHPTSE
jgi:hypothetical protein